MSTEGTPALALRGIVKRFPGVLANDRVDLEVAPGEVHAGRDGEAALLMAPMRFAIRPQALRARICARHPGASPSAQLASLDPRRPAPGLSRRDPR